MLQHYDIIYRKLEYRLRLEQRGGEFFFIVIVILLYSSFINLTCLIFPPGAFPSFPLSPPFTLSSPLLSSHSLQ